MRSWLPQCGESNIEGINRLIGATGKDLEREIGPKIGRYPGKKQHRLQPQVTKKVTGEQEVIMLLRDKVPRSVVNAF